MVVVMVGVGGGGGGVVVLNAVWWECVRRGENAAGRGLRCLLCSTRAPLVGGVVKCVAAGAEKAEVYSGRVREDAVYRWSQ